MTGTVTTADREPKNDPASHRRLVVVAVSADDADRGVAEWAANAVTGNDHVHVVHVYRPFRLPDCDWEIIRESQRRRTAEARRLAACGECPIRQAHRALQVDGSAIGGDPVEVLIELSAIVDVVILGADAEGSAADVTAGVVHGAYCPVVIVPPRAASTELSTSGRPVTLLLDEPDLSAAGLELAKREAIRLGTGLRVVELRSAVRHPEPESPQLLAEEQICLDERLLQWGRNEQVGVVGEVSLDEPASTARRVIGSSSFVVMSRSAVELLAGVDLPCPVAVVPGFEKG
jgi:nucleotide-binding universal stress UspA family protein